jgi:hypothetical protein
MDISVKEVLSFAGERLRQARFGERTESKTVA